MLALHDSTFRLQSNSTSGTADGHTQLTFREADGLLTAVYAGGTVQHGHAVTRWLSEDSLELLYHAVNRDGRLQAGAAVARFFDREDGLEMVLDWKWLNTGADESGQSVWELVKPSR